MKRNYPPEGFTERLNEAIYKSGLRPVEIQRKARISESCFYYYMRGDTTPSLMTLVNLCRVLDVSADYLLFGRVKQCNT